MKKKTWRWQRTGIVAGCLILILLFKPQIGLLAALQKTRQVPAKLVSSTTRMTLLAASAVAPQKGVLLKWVYNSLGFTDNGFNLYRKGPADASGGDVYTKIASTVQPDNSSTGTGDVTTTVDGKPVSLQAAVALTRKPLKANIRRKVFGPTVNPAASSREAFEELGAMQRSLLRDTKGAKGLNSKATLSQYSKLNMFEAQAGALEAAESNGTVGVAKSAATSGGGGGGGAATTATPVDVPTDPAVEAQQMLTLGALLRNDVAKTLGLYYEDTAAQTGKTYTYELRELQKDSTGKLTENPVGNCSLTVGADPVPQPATNFKAVQYDQETVLLRWDRDTSADNSANCVAYEIKRDGQILNQDKPIVVTNLQSAGPAQAGSQPTGAVIDPLYYWSTKADYRYQNTYSLVGIDSFGRRSQPVQIQFKLEDWNTPPNMGAPKGRAEQMSVTNVGRTHIYCAPSYNVLRLPIVSATAGGKVQVTGFKTKIIVDTEARYNVYRADGEDMTQTPKWTQVNTQPLAAREIQNGEVRGDGRALAIVDDDKSGPMTVDYFDNQVERDKYYVYCFRAFYPRNNVETPPSAIERVGVPDLVPSVAVGDLNGTYNTLVKPDTTFAVNPQWAAANEPVKSSAPVTGQTSSIYMSPGRIAKLQQSVERQRVEIDGRVTQLQKLLKLAPAERLKEAKKLLGENLDSTKLADQLGERLKQDQALLTQYTSLKAKYTGLKPITAENGDLGTIVSLTWKPVALKTPMHYKIYRASASLVQASSILAGASNSANSVAGTHKNLGGGVTYTTITDPNSVPAELWQYIGDSETTSFEDRVPKARAMHYVYRVVTVNRWGTEGKPTQLLLRLPATLKPQAPYVVSANSQNSGGVKVTWKTMPANDECLKYTVYRKRLSKPDPPVIKPTTSSGSTGVKSTVGTKGVVNARVDIAGLKTRITDRRINPARITPAERQAMTLSLADPSGWEKVTELTADPMTQPESLDYTDSTVPPMATYAYQIVAFDRDSWVSYASAPLSAAALKVSVAGVTALKAAADGRTVNLTWTKPAGDDILGYVVERADGTGANLSFVQISDTLTQTTFNDVAVMKGHSYTYRVKTMDLSGNTDSGGNGISFTLPTK